ncbi:MAG: SRPBCC family protein [Candidatus Sericytochromatia bacterium]|nr:SRPBCC family protein [Candidatus Sericytochromatia bacterium]
MANHRSLTALLLAGLLTLTAPVAFGLDRKNVLEAHDQEHVLLVRATIPAEARRIYGLLRDWSQRARFQKAPTFDHWEVAGDSATGVGAWAAYDLRLGDKVVRERVFFADEQDGRYLRERADRPQLPYEVHWLLEPIGDGASTALTIAIHVPNNRNWVAGFWQQWSTEPALRAAYAPLPALLTATLAATY